MGGAALLERDERTRRRVEAGISIDGPPVIRFPDRHDDRVRTAYRHTFFLRDESGTPRPETATDFYVPDWMRDGAGPMKWVLREVVRLIEAAHLLNPPKVGAKNG